MTSKYVRLSIWGKKGPILGLIAFYPPAEVRTIDKSFMTVVEKELVMTRTLLDRSRTSTQGIGGTPFFIDIPHSKIWSVSCLSRN